ncbi:hypothetical protein NP233_g11592 [Leucocoprinus birnbaumii]|uniref:Reverse transcriptase domain-containing protein n=1 Tax=Leucocoprinus birnbaumii TaxID=56174 RepID=A0AAD5YQT1_9AGAR|nr:hypothetical protein NP233_g11592 [Leucocoprinus birnbaumii]
MPTAKVGYWLSHFKESISVIIPKLGKPTYSTPKSFRPIALLNTLGKLIEKMISTHLQFDCIKHEVFHPNQLGSIRQRSTGDAGVFLTHLVRAGWAKGLKTSVIAFDIAQFFPSLNHEMLLGILAKGTRYLWNSFSSDLRLTDVGMGQGSALSPVLSALYLAPVIQLFERRAVHVGCDVLSYVNDSTLIVQHKRLEDNLLPLFMEHNKSELFHFTRQCDNASPPIVLDFESFMAASPLKPKTFWRYLGFYFDWTLSFREHVRYYSTKAISTVHAMGMLGNLLQRLTPKQNRILYQACVMPIARYGFHLWYNDFAKCKGHLQSLTRMQCCAALWIIATFWTSLMGGCEALAGLIPIHLHLRKLASQATYWVATLSRTHSVQSLIGWRDAPGAHILKSQAVLPLLPVSPVPTAPTVSTAARPILPTTTDVLSGATASAHHGLKGMIVGYLQLRNHTRGSVDTGKRLRVKNMSTGKFNIKSHDLLIWLPVYITKATSLHYN